MADRWILRGKVRDGAKRGAFFTQLDWVQTQCLQKLGFRPYPGTLNVEIAEEGLPVIEAVQKEGGIMLLPPDPQFCVGKALPVEIGGVCGALIIPSEEVKIHGKNVVEVIAGQRLKDALNVKDGDYVTLVIKRPSGKRPEKQS